VASQISSPQPPVALNVVTRVSFFIQCKIAFESKKKWPRLTISFSGEAFSLLLRVSGEGEFRRVDGWVTPAQEMRVSVKQRGRTFEADVDPGGRFEIPRLPGGPSRLWLVGRPPAAPSEEQELFATPTFEL